MNRAFTLSVATLLSIAQVLPAAGNAAQVQLRWSELGERIANRKVALVLPDGTHIAGKVRAVEAGGLRLRVSETTDRKAVPKGEQLIPRQSVSVLRLTEYRKLGRLLATTGAVAVAGAIVAAKYPDLYEGTVIIVVPAVVAAGMVGVAIGGYYTGKALDKRVTEIRVVGE